MTNIKIIGIINLTFLTIYIGYTIYKQVMNTLGKG